MKLNEIIPVWNTNQMYMDKTRFQFVKLPPIHRSVAPVFLGVVQIDLRNYSSEKTKHQVAALHCFGKLMCPMIVINL